MSPGEHLFWSSVKAARSLWSADSRVGPGEQGVVSSVLRMLGLIEFTSHFVQLMVGNRELVLGKVS